MVIKKLELLKKSLGDEVKKIQIIYLELKQLTDFLGIAEEEIPELVSLRSFLDKQKRREDDRVNRKS